MTQLVNLMNSDVPSAAGSSYPAAVEALFPALGSKNHQIS
jgi:hypothetical protein